MLIAKWSHVINLVFNPKILRDSDQLKVTQLCD